MRKGWFHISLILWGVFLIFLGRECYAKAYPMLYKDLEATARGGTMVAVGGTSTTVFYNPAGLALMNPKEGFEVQLIGISAGISQNCIDFAEDVKDVIESDESDDEKTQDLMDVFEKYLGETFYGDINSMYLTIAKRHSSFAWALGFFSHLETNGVIHQGFGTKGILSLDSFIDGGVFLGFSFPPFKILKHIFNATSSGYKKLEKIENKLWIGFDVKAVEFVSFEHDLLPVEIVNYIDNDTYWEDKFYYNIQPTVDFGLVIEPYPQSFLDPIFGFSILNIIPLEGKNKDDEKETIIPTTYNLGIALKPKIYRIFPEGGFAYRHLLQDFVIAFDVRDFTKAYEEDSDWGKRLYMGMGVKLFKSRPFSIGVNGGFYQGYPSYGATLTFLILRADFLCYSEEVGDYAGAQEDKRYLFSISIRW